jgi:hypothetical protein
MFVVAPVGYAPQGSRTRPRSPGWRSADTAAPAHESDQPIGLHTTPGLAGWRDNDYGAYPRVTG